MSFVDRVVIGGRGCHGGGWLSLLGGVAALVDLMITLLQFCSYLSAFPSVAPSCVAFIFPNTDIHAHHKGGSIICNLNNSHTHWTISLNGYATVLLLLLFVCSFIYLSFCLLFWVDFIIIFFSFFCSIFPFHNLMRPCCMSLTLC